MFIYGVCFLNSFLSMKSDAKWLAWFEQQFTAVAGSDGKNRFQQVQTGSTSKGGVQRS